jgi:hypothetical protein
MVIDDKGGEIVIKALGCFMCLAFALEICIVAIVINCLVSFIDVSF